MGNLADVKIGKLYELIGVNYNAPLKIRRRILELGFTNGQKVKVIRKSLLGKAYLVELRGFTLTIRKDIAQLINVK